MLTALREAWSWVLLLAHKPVELWLIAAPSFLLLFSAVGMWARTAKRLRFWTRRYRYREGLNELLRETEEQEKKKKKEQKKQKGLRSMSFS